MSLAAIAVELAIGAVDAGRQRTRRRLRELTARCPLVFTTYNAPGMVDRHGNPAWLRFVVAPVVAITRETDEREVQGVSVVINGRGYAVHREPAPQDRASFDATLDELELEAKWEKS